MTRPAAFPDSMFPKVTWESVAPADVLDALKTLGPMRAQGRIIGFRGEAPESLLDWCFDELRLAEAATGSEQRRHTSHVVGNAVKVLDSLFDAYLERDFLDVRLRPRAAFTAKLDVLKKRLGSKLPWRLIPAVVANPRNESEHARLAPSVEQAGLAAEAARVVLQAMIASSNPLHGPALAGHFQGGWSSDNDGEHVYVKAFPPEFAWAGRCSDGVPRVGVGVRSAVDTASVRFAELARFSEADHLRLLEHWDSFDSAWWRSETSMTEMMKLAGLHQPTT